MKPADPPIIGRDRELELLMAALKAGCHVLIEGQVGVGKTRLAKEAAERLRRPVIRLDGDERFTEEKLAGWFDPPAVIALGYCQASFQAGPLYRAMAEGALLFINELNRMPEGVQNILLPVLDENRLDIPRLAPIVGAPGFQVAATQNPKEFVGTALVSEALRDRFELLTLDYQSFEEEQEIVRLMTGLSDQTLISKSVFMTRATRTHPRVRRGASVRAAASLALIAAELGGASALERAAALALPTRIEFNDDLEEENRESFSDFVTDILEKKKTNPL